MSDGAKRIVAVIPARLNSSRFPRKPLMPILGLPMIEHVRRRCSLMSFLNDVIVATCDVEIKNEVERHGGKVVMTSDKHERATDRIEEVAQGLDADIFINVQGDEPLVSENNLKMLVQPFFSDEQLKCSCVIHPVCSEDELYSPNVVKVVVSNTLKLLYLSRSVIPGRAYDDSQKYYKQSGLMAFSKNSLHEYSKLSPTPLEKKESVDILRLLEHDFQIQAVLSNHDSVGVDVPEQIAIVEGILNTNTDESSIFKRISQLEIPL